MLIVPKAHVENIYSLDEETAAAVFGLTVQVAKAAKAALQPDGLNLIQANERAGQQDVFHFHMHVVARYAGDRDRIRLGWRNHLPPRSETKSRGEAFLPRRASRLISCGAWPSVTANSPRNASPLPNPLIWYELGESHRLFWDQSEEAQSC